MIVEIVKPEMVNLVVVSHGATFLYNDELYMKCEFNGRTSTFDDVDVDCIVVHLLSGVITSCNDDTLVQIQAVECKTV
jgi:hypothetical protein